jgi:hypothetical protein
MTAPKRRWFRFSLRALLIAISLVAILLGWGFEQTRRRQQAISNVERLGGWVVYADSAGKWTLYDDSAILAVPRTNLVRYLPQKWTDAFFGDGWRRAVSEIHIRDMQLSDSELGLLNYIDEVHFLDLQDSAFSRVALRFITRLNQLEVLSLERASIDEKPACDLSFLRELPNLKQLYLGGAKINGADLAYVKQLKQLQVLTLDYTPIHDDDLAELTDMRNLTNVNLNETPIGDQGVAHIRNLPRLRYVNLRNTLVSEQVLRELLEQFAERSHRH